MACKYCGQEIPADEEICTTCSVDHAEEKASEPVSPPPSDEKREADGKNILLFAIWGNACLLVFLLLATLLFLGVGQSILFCFFWSICGIVLSAIAKGKSYAYIRKYGALSGYASVGRVLATVGLVAGIVLAVLFILLLIVAIFAFMMLLGEFLDRIFNYYS